MFDSIKTAEDLFLVILAASILLATLVVFIMALHNFYMLKDALSSKETTTEPKQSWWSRLNYTVPINKEESILLSHNYDGIQELDNHLPTWWTGMFVACVIFAVLYMGVYHVWDKAPLMIDEYQNEMTAAQKQIAEYESKNAEKIDENSAKLMLDNINLLAKGEEIFKGKCGACHGQYGEGTVGPNLTDGYWLHGDGSIGEIFKVIKNGVPEKGMIAWKSSLKGGEIEAVSNYILSIANTKPANAKEPQGTLVANNSTK